MFWGLQMLGKKFCVAYCINYIYDNNKIISLKFLNLCLADMVISMENIQNLHKSFMVLIKIYKTFY